MPDPELNKYIVYLVRKGKEGSKLGEVQAEGSEIKRGKPQLHCQVDSCCFFFLAFQDRVYWDYRYLL